MSWLLCIFLWPHHSNLCHKVVLEGTINEHTVRTVWWGYSEYQNDWFDHRSDCENFAKIVKAIED